MKEELSSNMPKPWGQAVNISAFVDANLAGDFVMQRSHSRILIFVQNTPIIL